MDSVRIRTRTGLSVLALLLVVVVAALAAVPAAAQPGTVGTAGAAGKAGLSVVAPGRLNLSPEAPEWVIPFVALVPGRAAGLTATVSAVEVDGQAVPFTVRAASVPVLESAGRFTGPEIARYARIKAQAERRLPATAADEAFLRAVAPRVEEFARAASPAILGFDPTSRVVIAAAALYPGRGGGERHTVRVTLRGRHAAGAIEETSFETEVGICAYPADGVWVPGDLHAHSTYSDGWDSIATLVDDWSYYGYEFLYMTDHCGSVTSQWASYASSCRSASHSDCVALPGTETKTAAGGHLLAYGVANTSGIPESTYSGQQLIDNVNANNPSQPSSASIAHPNAMFMSWSEWSVLRQRGMEIMSGIQWYFDPNCGPMTRWRSECQRLAPYTFRYGYMPSPRTGSDWHNWLVSSIEFVTYAYVPSEWTSTMTYDQKKAAADSALYNGRVVASNWGSAALLRINGNAIGSVVDGVAGGTTLNFSVTVYAAYSDTYRVRVYRGNMAETVYDASASISAGGSRQWTFTKTFPGGDQYYWVYVSDGDDVYTSPIYISSNLY
jgi:hypothetical protein